MLEFHFNKWFAYSSSRINLSVALGEHLSVKAITTNLALKIVDSLCCVVALNFNHDWIFCQQCPCAEGVEAKLTSDLFRSEVRHQTKKQNKTKHKNPPKSKKKKKRKEKNPTKKHCFIFLPNVRPTVDQLCQRIISPYIAHIHYKLYP